MLFKRLKANHRKIFGKKNTKLKKILPTVITTYNPNNPNLLPIINQSVEQLKSSETLRDKLNKKTLIFCLLCKIRYINNEKVKVSKCSKSCICCSYITDGREFKFKYRDIPFKVKSPFNCNTSNLLYVFTFRGCNEEYIGQTGRTLRERVVLYRQHIRTKEYRMSLVEEHLRTPSLRYFLSYVTINRHNKQRNPRINIYQAAKNSIESTKLINLIIAQYLQ